MDIDINRLKDCNLIQITYGQLGNYIGFPVLVETPEYTYAYNGMNNKVASFEGNHTFEWTIFNGTISILPQPYGRIYWTLKEFATE